MDFVLLAFTATSAQPNQLCVSPVFTIALSVVVMFFIVIAFALGVLVGVCRTKTKEASATVSAAQSEAASPAITETATAVELERVHEYEDIILTETGDVNAFTSNVAYGAAPQFHS